VQAAGEQSAVGGFVDRTGFGILDHGPDDGFNLFEEVTAEAWRTPLVESGRLSHLRQGLGVDPSYHPNRFLRSLRES